MVKKSRENRENTKIRARWTEVEGREKGSGKGVNEGEWKRIWRPFI
jgi:hypothetical protein